MQMSKMDEVIIVVPRNALFNNGELVFQGTESNPSVVAKLDKNIEANFGTMRRGDAEENERFKQPIPYAVIRRGNDIFVYERLSGGGEARLHNKLSIGAGGHMNQEGSSFAESLMNNLKRELEEELDIKSESMSFKSVGYINDDEDAVGRVHIAILVVIDLDKDATVDVRETDQLDGDFVSLETLTSPAIYDRLENWSKIAVDTLSPLKTKKFSPPTSSKQSPSSLY
jgi:predicted NUDIX family phosphoesterase